ncbi:hypothetical protein FCK90_10935 [Kocuria coralli]|uniref:DUF4149 domain-containing protein n=1 Tax=Kocuria coralli TaxID=1461025 RepID=A0A5J5KWN3_9MICC|nr:hypothetical protein [Kocuria coralli]KAA9393690.1 hypothetical protein FCK90_10935 [Kocuria coralli]
MTGPMAAAAAAFVWFGMVLAISFVEAPLKFRAPGVTTQIGLGIGRIVFAALNTAEILLALVVAFGLLIGRPWSQGSVPAGAWLLVAAVVLLAVQLLVVRPSLRRRSARVLAGGTAERRSHAHWVYVGFEVVKAVCLLLGALLVAGAAQAVH